MNQPTNQGIQVGLAAVYGQLGEAEKARATFDHILRTWPDLPDDPRGWFIRRRFSPELLEHLMDGLRKAGVEVPPAG
jgi:hypothetical protein